MMPRVLAFAILWVPCLILFYAVGALGSWNWNPGGWEPVVRWILSAFSFATALIVFTMILFSER